ncbi:MAG TPA: hypothetical protein VIZ17_06455 [Acetobacteraceae bacterium]
MPDEGVALNQRDSAQCKYEADAMTPVGFHRTWQGAVADGLNQGFAEARLFGECMQAKGYHLESVAQDDAHTDELLKALSISCTQGKQDACDTAQALATKP